MKLRNRVSSFLLICLLFLFLVPHLVILGMSVVTVDSEGQRVSASQYAALLSDPDFHQRFGNSAVIACGALAPELLLSILLALALSRAASRIRFFLLLTLMVMLLLPFQSYMLPVFQLYKRWGLYNSHLALILFCAFSPVGPLLLYFFMRMIPEEQWEAARLETNSIFCIAEMVILPQIAPAIFILLLLSFVEAWNLVEPAIILLQFDELKPLSVSLNDFQNVSWAAAALYSLPVECFFMLCIPALRRLSDRWNDS